MIRGILTLHENLCDDELLIITSFGDSETTISPNDTLSQRDRTLLINRKENGAVIALNPDWIVKCRTFRGMRI